MLFRIALAFLAVRLLGVLGLTLGRIVIRTLPRLTEQSRVMVRTNALTNP